MDFRVKCVDDSLVFQNIDKFISAETNYIVKTLVSLGHIYEHLIKEELPWLCVYPALRGSRFCQFILETTRKLQPFHVVSDTEWNNMTIMTLLFFNEWMFVV